MLPGRPSAGLAALIGRLHDAVARAGEAEPTRTEADLAHLICADSPTQ